MDASKSEDTQVGRGGLASSLLEHPLCCMTKPGASCSLLCAMSTMSSSSALPVEAFRALDVFSNVIFYDFCCSWITIQAQNLSLKNCQISRGLSTSQVLVTQDPFQSLKDAQDQREGCPSQVLDRPDLDRVYEAASCTSKDIHKEKALQQVNCPTALDLTASRLLRPSMHHLTYTTRWTVHVPTATNICLHALGNGNN